MKFGFVAISGSVPITGASRSPIQTGRQGRYAPQITFAEGLPRWTTRHVTAGIRSAPYMAVWRHMPSCSFEIGIGMPRVFAVRSAPCWCRRGPARRKTDHTGHGGGPGAQGADPYGTARDIA